MIITHPNSARKSKKVFKSATLESYQSKVICADLIYLSTNKAVWPAHHISARHVGHGYRQHTEQRVQDVCYRQILQFSELVFTRLTK